MSDDVKLTGALLEAPEADGPRPPHLSKGCYLAILIAVIVLIAAVFLWGGNKTKAQGKPAASPTQTNVAKRDGSYDERANDLQNLAEDYVFYRMKILEAAKSGDDAVANKYRKAFNQINKWLSEYKDADVSDAISKAEKKRFGQ